MNAEDLTLLIKKKYDGDAYAFLPQVADGTGMNKGRTADALVMSLWPSRGIHLYGFEVKVNRGDWLNELKNPAKAEAFAQYCDFWFMVATPGTIKHEELPPNWGLMEPSSNGLCLQIKKQAIILKPKVICKNFLAALLRNVSKYAPSERDRKANYDSAFKAGLAHNEMCKENQIKRLENDIERLQKTINEFESLSGIRLSSWNAEEIGKAVKVHLAGGSEYIRKELIDLSARAKRISDLTESYIKDLGK
jgi:hypothetical protein